MADDGDYSGPSGGDTGDTTDVTETTENTEALTEDTELVSQTDENEELVTNPEPAENQELVSTSTEKTYELTESQKSVLQAEPDKTYLYSGVGSPESAKELAAQKGGTTIDMCLDKSEEKLPQYNPHDKQAVEAWNEASITYCQNAKGDVHVMMSGDFREDGVFMQKELPTLVHNKNVTSVTVLEVVKDENGKYVFSGKETLIHAKHDQ